MTYRLLSVGNDAKTVKGQSKGFLTGILYLAPAAVAGGPTVCPFSTEGCRRVCLYTAGRGGFNIVQQARIKKTKLFQEEPLLFLDLLRCDLEALLKDAKSQGFVPAVRLNGTSDILWEDYGIMQEYPDLQFYDYSKYPPKLRQNLPSNYHLTHSFSEKPVAHDWSDGWFKRGVNSAVVFYLDKQGRLPDTFQIAGKDYKVIDGDESDLRFTDPKGVVVGLKVKGKARKDNGDGFIQGARAA